jgi:hypothetical protein
MNHRSVFLRVQTFALLALAVAGGCQRETVDPITPDMIPPLPPAGLIVQAAQDGFVYLRWLRNSEADLQSYVVYRREAGLADFTVIDSTTSSYLWDSQRSYDSTYEYQVRALDQSGNLSAASNTVSAVSPNLEAPQTPELLRVAASNVDGRLSMQLDWLPSPDDDLRGYQVYRSAVPDIDTARQAYRFTEDSRVVDDAIPATGATWYYAVAAVDRGGKRSAPTPVDFDFATDAPVLLAPADAARVSDYPIFRWNTVRGAMQYRLLLSASPAGDQIWSADVNDTGTGELVLPYGGPSLSSGRTYFWRVATLTRSGGPINALSSQRSFQAIF